MIYTMKNILTDKSAVMDAIFIMISGLFFLGVVVWIIFPIENYIANTMVEMGAHKVEVQFIQKMMAWSILIMGISLVLYGFMRAFKTTFDQGQGQLPPTVIQRRL